MLQQKLLQTLQQVQVIRQDERHSLRYAPVCLHQLDGFLMPARYPAHCILRTPTHRCTLFLTILSAGADPTTCVQPYAPNQQLAELCCGHKSRHVTALQRTECQHEQMHQHTYHASRQIAHPCRRLDARVSVLSRTSPMSLSCCRVLHATSALRGSVPS